MLLILFVGRKEHFASTYPRKSKSKRFNNITIADEDYKPVCCNHVRKNDIVIHAYTYFDEENKDSNFSTSSQNTSDSNYEECIHKASHE